MRRQGRPITQRMASTRSSHRRRSHMPVRVGPEAPDDTVRAGRPSGAVIEHGLQLAVDRARTPPAADSCVVP